MTNLYDAMHATAYPGRGIVLGTSEDGKNAVCAYFIMGRSTNSRNRVFVEKPEGALRTEAYDPALVSDPSLIIYWPVRFFGRNLIVTNGDQTDTILKRLSEGGTFDSALRERKYEPDEPNYTPRISGLMRLEDGYSYRLSVLRHGPGGCERFFYEYESGAAGVGHFIHTYQGDGSPLPAFVGEPETVALAGEIDDVARDIWAGLNNDNRVSLFVRFIDIATGAYETRVINKNLREAR